jgi:hypothetical protein
MQIHWETVRNSLQRVNAVKTDSNTPLMTHAVRHESKNHRHYCVHLRILGTMLRRYYMQEFPCILMDAAVGKLRHGVLGKICWVLVHAIRTAKSTTTANHEDWLTLLRHTRCTSSRGVLMYLALILSSQNNREQRFFKFCRLLRKIT